MSGEQSDVDSDIESPVGEVAPDQEMFNQLKAAYDKLEKQRDEKLRAATLCEVADAVDAWVSRFYGPNCTDPAAVYRLQEYVRSMAQQKDEQR